MERRIYITGVGGQGVMLVGKLFTYGAFSEDKDVLFVPTYGGEQRGGASNCAIMISDDRVGAPNVKQYDVVVYMAQSSYDAAPNAVRPNGIAILNTSSIKTIRDDGIKTILVDAMAEAAILGSEKAANMVLLGALVQAQDVVSMDYVIKALTKQMASKPQLLELNKKAILRGAEIAAAQLG
jgi:2-oxoglutarate ferredoxin oxidoreductase subunit gamma